MQLGYQIVRMQTNLCSTQRHNVCRAVTSMPMFANINPSFQYTASCTIAATKCLTAIQFKRLLLPENCPRPNSRVIHVLKPQILVLSAGFGTQQSSGNFVE